MPIARASELHRFVRCPASAVLPRGPERDTVASDFGTEVHAYVSSGVATPRVAEWLERQLPPVSREVWWFSGWHDTLYALDTDSDNVIVWRGLSKPERDEVRAAVGPSFVVGESDWASWDGPVPHVSDVKTGQHPGPPAELEQLLTYGRAEAKAAKADLCVLSVDYWPADGRQPPIRTSTPVSTASLDNWWHAEVVPASRLARGPRPPVNPGDHCRFCPCVSCPHNYEANHGDFTP